MKLRVAKGTNPQRPWLVMFGDVVLDTAVTWRDALTAALRYRLYRD